MFLNAVMSQKHLDKGTPHTAEGFSESAEKRDFDKMLTHVGKTRDKDAFIQLFEHFAPRIKSFLMKGGANPEIADELAQETMLTMWKKADKYDSRQAAASTWIFTIARNKRIDRLRKMKRYTVDSTDPITLEDTAPSPRENTLLAEENQIITEALKTLPKEQADLIKMSFFEDKSHGVIAEETGIPLGTVKSRIRLALERLKRNQTIKSTRV